MDYTYKKLDEMTKEAHRKAEQKKLSAEEASLASAAAYCLDLMDIGNDNNTPLNLTILCEDNVIGCLMKAHAINMKSQMSIEESREKLIKLLAGYELFAICKSNNERKARVRIVMMKHILLREIKPIIETIPGKAGTSYRFDVYEIARQTVAGFVLNDLNSEDQPFFIGRMLVFHDHLTNNLLEKLT